MKELYIYQYFERDCLSFSGSYTTMKEILMIPKQDMGQLMNTYKEQITSDPLLTKASRMAAERHVLLKDKTIPPSLKQTLAKPLSSNLRSLTKKIRHEEDLASTIANPNENKQETVVDKLIQQALKGNLRRKKIAIPTSLTTNDTVPKKKTKTNRSRTTREHTWLDSLHAKDPFTACLTLKKEKETKRI